MSNITDKKFYTKKALEGYSFSGYWNNLYHYSKRVNLYGGELQKSYMYKCISLSKQELEDNKLLIP